MFVPKQDGNGGSGGVTKPKFFSAHNMNGNSKVSKIWTPLGVL